MLQFKVSFILFYFTFVFRRKELLLLLGCVPLGSYWFPFHHQLTFKLGPLGQTGIYPK